MRSTIFVLLIAAFLLSCAPGSAQKDVPSSGDTAVSFDASLQQLESATGLAASSASSMLERVEALERKVFGQPGSGAISDRIKNLRQAVNGHQTAGKEAPVAPPTSLQSSVEQSRTLAPMATAPAGATAAPLPVASDDMQLATMFPLTNVYPPRFFRIEPPGSSATNPGDYFAEVMQATKGKIFRFEQMPIPVYITPYPDKQFTDACIRGFESWEDLSGGVVRFVQVADPTEARIQVTWSHLGFVNKGDGCTLGAHTITKWNTRPTGSLSLLNIGMVPLPLGIPHVGTKYSVKPQIIEVNLDLMLSKHPEIRYITLQNVVTHELGHALGLLGHSPTRSDMMFSITDEHSRLSRRDINTITRVYQQKADVSL